MADIKMTKMDEDNDETEIIGTKTPDLTQSKISLHESTKLFFKNITIEPVVFFAYFAYTLQMIPTSYLLFERVCTVDEGNSHELCQQILYNKTCHHLKDQLQSRVSNWMIILIVSGLLPDILVKLVIGSWSDKHGRKPILLMSILGSLLRCFCFLFVNDYKNAGAKWIIIASLPASILSSSAIWCISISYISDVSPKANRTLRILLMELCIFLGGLCGEYGGGTISQKYGFQLVYILGVSLSAFAFLLCLLFVRETVESSTGFSTRIRDLFRCNNIAESWKTFIRRRGGNARMHLMLLILASVFDHLLRRCYSAVDTLYTQAMYDWNSSQLARASTIITATQGFFFITSAFIFKGRTNVADLKLAVICFALSAIGYAIVAFSVHTWMFYLGRLLGVFVFIPAIVINSNLTKVANSKEIGKIITIRSAALSLVSPETSVIFIGIYKGSQEFFRGLPYLITSGLYIFPILFFIIMHIKPLYNPDADVQSDVDGQENAVAVTEDVDTEEIGTDHRPNNVC